MNCANCKSGGVTLRCGACPDVKYCSLKCRDSHWPEHKDVCGSLTDRLFRRTPKQAPLAPLKWTGDAKFALKVDRAIGAVMGQAVGDHLGSLVEFLPASALADDKLLDYVMSAPGSTQAHFEALWPGVDFTSKVFQESLQRGTLDSDIDVTGASDSAMAALNIALAHGSVKPLGFKLSPGQITDDTEMAMCIAHGLLDQSADPNPAVARRFGMWAHGEPGPFDIGSTTINALLPLQSRAAQSVIENADAVISAAAAKSPTSKSNGALMRSIVYAAWGCNGMSDERLVSLARSGAQLTHGNAAGSWACAIYVLICRSLMSGATWDQAYGRAWQYMRMVTDEDAREAFDILSKPALDVFVSDKGDPRYYIQGFPNHATEGIKNGSWMNGLRVALFLALNMARGDVTYREAIRYCISVGGDTDTSAAIAGGMLGSMLGYKELRNDPQVDSVVAKVLTARDDKGVQRPAWLHPSLLPGLAERLVENGPTK